MNDEREAYSGRCRDVLLALETAFPPSARKS